MHRLTPEREVDKYIASVKKGGKRNFIAGSLPEEVRYVLHNKERYIYALTVLDSYVVNSEGYRLLDIGTSPFTAIIRQRYPKIGIDTVDYRPALSELAKQYKANFRVGDFSSKKFTIRKNCYNFVCYLEVIEHLQRNHKHSVEKILASLKKGGLCLVQTPNKYSPKAIVMDGFASSLWSSLTDAPKPRDEFRHFHEFSLSELTRLIRRLKGARILTSEYQMYFDDMSSSMVYRKGKGLLLVLLLNYYLTRLVPPLRRGMSVLFERV